MKVIFLDIDGVLNAEDDFGGRKKPNPTVDGVWGISKSKVRRLKEIVDASEASIVLVSSWKSEYEEYMNDGYKNTTGKYLYNKLRECNLYIKETTLKYNKSNRSKYRAMEIKSYLKEHPEVDTYIILDDQAHLYNEELIKHLICTFEDTGLDSLKTAEAIYKLTGIKTDKYKEHEWLKKVFLNVANECLPKLVADDLCTVTPMCTVTITNEIKKEINKMIKDNSKN